MDTNILPSRRIEVGQVFTPVSWAEWLVERWGILEAWIGGASICEPTAGQGAFAFALFRLARSKGVEITPELLSRLTLIEVQPSHIHVFRQKARREFGIEYPLSQLLGLDVITHPPDARYDILLGNPPWSNFADLPEFYKETLKPHFVAEGLVPDKKAALLGSSRVDIAALVLKVVLGKMLNRKGIGCFFLPLSLFFGDGAHQGFRNYSASNRRFSVDEVYEFKATKVFENISTSYCCAKFTIDNSPEFPVAYFKEIDGNWVKCRARPFERQNDQWCVIERGDARDSNSAVKIQLPSYQKPRQGVNTCGANSIFIFDEKPTFLPDDFVFPLLTKEIWKQPASDPKKWVLLPYNVQTGGPLSWKEIEVHNKLERYLVLHKGKLENRKGKLIRSTISKGVWWSLLGVGPYSFSPYRVVWEAYGQRRFCPIVRSCMEGKAWQANQAMHAFIPCWTKGDADHIRSALLDPKIPDLLKQLNGEGKCNWAQPGKIKDNFFRAHRISSTNHAATACKPGRRSGRSG